MVVGNFDGVHLGHRHLIHQAAAIAANLGALVGTLTFEPHPRAVFSDARSFRLASALGKRGLLVAAGADFVTVEPFTPALGHLSPEEFVREYLVRRLRVRHVVVGEDYRFGHHRAGDVALLRSLGARLGFGVTAPGKLRADQACVSSTRIRELLHAGEVRAAGALLGRSWEVRGRVLTVPRGKGRGRVLVRADDADYVRLPPGPYDVRVTDPDTGEQNLAVAMVRADDFTLALEGSLPEAATRLDIAFHGARQTPAQRKARFVN